jgi:mRNA interferase RelE/StbE
MYQISLTRTASKEIKKLHNPTRSRILKAIEQLKSDPFPAGCKKLTGNDDFWRIRVGDYRIIYYAEGNTMIITITRVAHRKDVYGNL